MNKARLITYWVEQDQAIKIQGKPELVADYTSVAGEDGLTSEEWVGLAKELKTATVRYSTKHKDNKRKGVATKRKRTTSEETRKTKRTKKNSDDSEDSTSEDSEDHGDSDIESEDQEASLSDGKPSKGPKLLFGYRILTGRADETEAQRKARRTRQRGRHSATDGDASGTEDRVAATKRSWNTSATSKEPARRYVADSDDPVHKTANTKRTSATPSMLPHPRSVRRVKGGVPGSYKRFKPVHSDSSGDSPEELDDYMSTFGNGVVAPRGFNNLSAASMLTKASKKGKEPTSQHKHEHKDDGSDLLPRPLPLSHDKQMSMLQEYTEMEDGDKPEYDKWAKRHAATVRVFLSKTDLTRHANALQSSDKDTPFSMPYGMSPVRKRGSKEVGEAEEDEDEDV